MSHFYGGISGQAGEATRMGSKGSGYRAYAQTHQARISISLGHLDRTEPPYTMPDTGAEKTEGDIAHVTIGGGHSTYYRDRSVSFNLNNVAAALDSGDPKVERIWQRIESEFRKLNEEAPKAIKRTETRRRREQRRREREKQRQAKERRQIRQEMQPEEKARVVRLLHGVELDADGNFAEDSVLAMQHANLRYDANKHIIIDMPNRYRYHSFDVTDGVWLLPCDPEDLDFNPEGFGWRQVDAAVLA